MLKTQICITRPQFVKSLPLLLFLGVWARKEYTERFGWKQTEGKRELRRSKLRCVSNIKRDLREMGRRGHCFYSCVSMCGKLVEIRENDNENSTLIIYGESDWKGNCHYSPQLPAWSFRWAFLNCNCITSFYSLTHYSGRVTQICVFNTVKLGTSASSP